MDPTKLKDTVEMLRLNWEIRRGLSGDEHPKSNEAAEQLAGIYFAIGKLDEAFALLRIALQSRRKRFGDKHEDTQRDLLVVGQWCRQMGHSEEAIALLESLMASLMANTKREDGDPKVLECRSLLGFAYGDMGRLKEATEQLQAALQLIPETLADNPEYAWLLRNDIACTYRQFGLVEQCESLEFYLRNTKPTVDLLQAGLRKWTRKVIGYEFSSLLYVNCKL